MNNHPEKLETEIYLGNYTYDNLCHCGWKSKRVGEIAYDIYGRIIHQNYWHNKLVPVFILKEEVQNRIKNPEYFHSIEVYQRMLNSEKITYDELF